jgi:gamma-glutamyl:cysteine ligase YbdK (ATP-grasp superfamily)
MGEEIQSTRFEARDFAAFESRLRQETELLIRWFREDCFADTEPVGGFELEAWLVDRRGRPAPINAAFLGRVASDLVVPELANFNVELNGQPRGLEGACLREMQAELGATWKLCNRVAGQLGARLAMIGTLPTALEEDFSLENMSELHRYRALNEQVLRMRRGQPFRLDIRGREALRTTHESVMLEAGATSFQIHFQCRPRDAARLYNIAKIISAPMVAATANSPYLFGRDLWDETRIPLFEQAVSVAGPPESERVSFGVRYVKHSLGECFTANLERYPVLVPRVCDDPPEAMSHLRFHNGTIWRWTRPLIGFGPDARPQLRIEHRVVPSGPSIVDLIANAAFFFGLAYALTRQRSAWESRIPFATARENFYAAARHGLEAQLVWLDARPVVARALLLEELIPAAQRGLEILGIDPEDRDRYCGIVAERVRTGRTGAAWQRAFLARHGADMAQLMAAYLEHQDRGAPVHEWDLAC